MPLLIWKVNDILGCVRPKYCRHTESSTFLLLSIGEVTPKYCAHSWTTSGHKHMGKSLAKGHQDEETEAALLWGKA